MNGVGFGHLSVSSFPSSSCMLLGLFASAAGGLFGWGFIWRSKYGIARSVVSEGVYGLCHSILFSSFVIGFGFEHVASVYASSRVLVVLVALIPFRLACNEFAMNRICC